MKRLDSRYGINFRGLIEKMNLFRENLIANRITQGKSSFSSKRINKLSRMDMLGIDLEAIMPVLCNHKIKNNHKANF